MEASATESRQAQLERVRSAAARRRATRKADQDAAADLRAALLAADQAAGGNYREALVSAAEGGLSRKAVFATVGAADLFSDARKALPGPEWHVFQRGDRVYGEIDTTEIEWPGDNADGDDPEPIPGAWADKEHDIRIGLMNMIGGGSRELYAAGLRFAEARDALTETLMKWKPVEVLRIEK